MEKGASFLFAGTHFNKKQFASDFERFKVIVSLALCLVSSKMIRDAYSLFSVFV